MTAMDLGWSRKRALRDRYTDANVRSSSLSGPKFISVEKPMLRGIFAALAVVVLAQVCATGLPLVIPHGATCAVLTIVLSFGPVAVVLGETELLKLLAVVAGTVWLGRVVLRLHDVVLIVVVSLSICAWNNWFYQRTRSDETTDASDPSPKDVIQSS